MKKRILGFLMLFSSGLFAQVNLNVGLYLCYPLDGNANDYSGNLNNGTLFGGAASPDRFGNTGSSILFNGTSDYITLDTTLPDMPRFSYSVWVYHTKLTYPSTIFSDADSYPYYDNFFNMSNDGIGIDANKIGGSVNRMDAYPLGNYNPIITGKNLNGAWHHLVWVNDSVSQKVYIDTVLTASLNMTGTNIGFHNPNPSIARFGDGVSNGGGYFQYFQGNLDDIRIYSRPLNFAEIKLLYTGPSCTNSNPTGISSSGLSASTSIFPNPFSSHFSFKTDLPLKNATLVICDVLGSEIKRMNFSGQETEISTNNIAPGIYFYRVTEENRVISTGKLIAE